MLVNNITCAVASKGMIPEEIMMYRFRGYITPLILVLGIFGNILVIIAFSRMQRKVPCRFNLYVLAISISHSTELVFNGFLDDFLGRGLYWLSDCRIVIKLDTGSVTACKFISFIPELAAFCSTNLLAVFSVDRVLTIYKPLSCRGDQHIRYTGYAICGVIFLGLVLHLPLPIQSGLVASEGQIQLTEKHCQFIDSLSIGAQYSLYLSIYGTTFFPVLTVLITDVLIFFKLRVLLHERSILCSNAERSSAELRRIVGHLALTTVFFIIMAPICVVIALRQQSDFHQYKITFPNYANKLVQLSRLFSSFESLIYATSFPTYFAFLCSFRKELRLLFNCTNVIHRQCGRKIIQHVHCSVTKENTPGTSSPTPLTSP